MEIPQFDASEVQLIMLWYQASPHTIHDLTEEINRRLREKAEVQQDRPRRPIRPNCF